MLVDHRLLVCLLAIGCLHRVIMCLLVIERVCLLCACVCVCGWVGGGKVVAEPRAVSLHFRLDQCCQHWCMHCLSIAYRCLVSHTLPRFERFKPQLC